MNIAPFVMSQYGRKRLHGNGQHGGSQCRVNDDIVGDTQLGKDKDQCRYTKKRGADPDHAHQYSTDNPDSNDNAIFNHVPTPLSWLMLSRPVLSD